MDQLVAMIFIIGGILTFVAVPAVFFVREKINQDDTQTREIEVQV